MKNAFISVLILFSGAIAAQECKIDLHTLAQPDVNMIQLNKFGQSGLFNIVLTGGFDTVSQREILDHISQWFLDQSSRIKIVNIKDVKKLDDSCHYLKKQRQICYNCIKFKDCFSGIADQIWQ